MRFDVRLPVSLEFMLDLGVDKHRFAADIAVPLALTPGPAATSRSCSAWRPAAGQVDYGWGRGLRASIMQHAAGVEGELQRFVAKYVAREVDKPYVLAARVIDVSRAIDRAIDSLAPKRPEPEAVVADFDEALEAEIRSTEQLFVDPADESGPAHDRAPPVTGSRPVAELHFFTGTMDSGKSTLALQTNHNHAARGRVGRIFTAHDRAGKAILSSRLGLTHEAIEVTADFDFWRYVVDSLTQGAHAADPRPARRRPARRDLGRGDRAHRARAHADQRASHGPDAIAGLASSRATNEDCYVMQRMMRAAIGTHNIDNCSRVCHSPTSWALRKSLGLSGATGSFDDIEAADAAIIIGANPTEGHPVVGARIKQATLRGLRLVTIDPRRIELSDYAVLHLSPRPGSNAAIMLGLAHVVARDGLIDRPFLEARTEGWDAVEDLLADYTPADVQRISGIPAADLERAAHIYAEAGEASIMWGLGVTEHQYGSEVVRLICNLALMCGKVGRPGSALLPLRGQNNVQGSSDMGALPDTFTGYQSVARRGRRAALRGALGRRDEARARAEDPRDVRRRGRRRPEGDVHLRRGRRADRPEHDARRRGAAGARVPRRAGHLRERDDALRRRRPAGVVVSGEERHVHERRAAHPARRGGGRPARRGAHGLRHPRFDLRRPRPRDAVRHARRRHGRGRRADAGLGRRIARAARPRAGCSGRSPPTAPTRRSCTGSGSRCRAAGRGWPRCPTSRPAARRRTSFRSCSSPAGGWSTTTPAR